MIIGIDGNEANVTRRVGIGEYAFELLQQFEKEHDTTFYIYLKEPPLGHMPKERKGWVYRVVGPRRLWTQFGLPIALFRQRDIDVFFTPTHYAPRFSPVPTAVAVMDLSYILFPHLFKKDDLYQLTQWTKYSVKQAAVVFTISQASKNDIIQLYHKPAEQVIVTYPGIKNMDKKEITKMGTEQTGKYILFVGTLQPRKNIERLIEAFSFVREKHKDVTLIIVGKKGWQYEAILEAPKRWQVEDSVIFKDFVNDIQLADLYTHATCLVFPSLYEGFGLPLLEAMQHDCPVISSNVSSLPEVGGDAVLYIDPKDPYDIAQKIEQMLSDSALRKKLITLGKQQIKKFTWEKTAKETLAVLKTLGRQHEK